MTEKKIRYAPLIAVPPFRTGVTHPEILFDLIQIAKQGWTFLRIGNQRIDAARNKAARALLKNDEFTHLLMLDADQRHKPETVRQLGRRWADDQTRLVISALYHRRGEPYEPLAFNQDEDGHMYQLTSTPPGIGKVDYLGTGCILIAREVFERIPEPWFKYDYPIDEHGVVHYPSEDIWFSRKCREAGIDLWLDTTIESAHHGTKWITSKDWEEARANDPMGILFGDVGVMDDPGTVLYVGARPAPACSNIMDYLATAGATIDLLEIWEKNCQSFEHDPRLRNVMCGDVRENFWPSFVHYDWVVWWHGPEHIERNGLEPVIKDLGAISDHILLGCPWGKYEQGEMYGNPHEEHLTHWQPEDFEALGFAVRAVGKDGNGNIIAWR